MTCQSPVIHRWFRTSLTCLLIILSMTIYACSAIPLSGFSVGLVAQSKLSSVRSWAYQLQGRDGRSLNLQPLRAFPVDLVVIDYSGDGGESGEFSRQDITRLKNSEKMVLAYMSIGAADAGRFYADNPSSTPFIDEPGKSLLGPENEDFPGTFFAKFWLRDWQKILFGNAPLPLWINTTNPNNYLERIIIAGFDGVYLDDIDSYQQFDQASGDGSRPSAAMEMLLFIRSISTWAKAKQFDFLVFPQNGENLVDDALEGLDSNGDGQLDHFDLLLEETAGQIFIDIDRNRSFGQNDVKLAVLDSNRDVTITKNEIENAYFDSIDGLGAEDFFFKGDARENNPFIDTVNSDDDRIEDFKFTGSNYLLYADHKIPIFNVEYLSDDNDLGLAQYCQAFLPDFQFSNPAITSITAAPTFSSASLKSLLLIPFQAPSRDLSTLPAHTAEQRCNAGDQMLSNSFGAVVRFRTPSWVTTAMSSMRTPPQPDR